MTVLRSREILSTSKPRNAVAEPMTPPKTSEISNQDLGVDVGAGSIMVSKSGSARRVSARLAKKLGENFEVVSGKRKKVEGTFLTCVDIINMNGRHSDVKLGVESSCGIGSPDTDIVSDGLQEFGDGVVTKLVNDNVKFSVSKLGFSCDRDDALRDTKESGRRKRRFSAEVNALEYESSEKDEEEKGFLSLRSGKRVVKRQTNVKNSEASIRDDVPDQSSSLEKSSGSEELVKDSVDKTRDEKRKMKMAVKNSSTSGKIKWDDGASSSNTVENVKGRSDSGVDEALPSNALQATSSNVSVSDIGERTYWTRYRTIARRIASRFAHFPSQDEINGHAHDVAITETSNAIEDWPGPFSTAMKIIRDRGANSNGERRRGFSTDKSETVELKWIPKSQEFRKHQKQLPSLQSMCLSILSENADAITSLDFVPDALRHKICWFLCDSRRMNSHFLELLVNGNPTEVRVRDCSWLSEELFDKIFKGCNTSRLTVLQLDQGGVCIPDYTLCSALARSPNNLPALTMISLKGAYRLSDAGLSMLASAAPCLKSIDVSQCPLLTSQGIRSLVSPLLRELYIDNCLGIDAMLILPHLQKLDNLEVLSVAGIPTVCDDFVAAFVSAHASIKDLCLADCMELTDSSLKVIGETCSDLRAIDLTNLCKLTNISILYLANGCQAIQTLKLCRNAFSDEAIAAYLDVCGASLKCLMLNNVIQVSSHTALSLARNCKNLRSLDLSWCRNLSNEALGLIVDSCELLEVLKLFGCTQVTNVFVDGHSNPQVKLIGLKMTPIFKHIDVPDFLVGPLRYLS